MTSRRGPRAFTLIEIMVTVAAFALIAVGLAVIFQGVGKTVTVGRRVSNLTTMAANIERQMRSDFASITRDGFFVIANAHVNDGNPVPAYAQQPPAKQRARRADEIVFFATGQFRSAREPLAPGHLPQSREARIYYGHGQRLEPDRSNPNTTYLRPGVDDDNIDPAIGLGGQVGGNPNRYPSGWTLLRHVTVLAGTPSTLRSYPSPFGGPTGPNNECRESDTQTSLQPAASNIFRVAARLEPCNGVATTYREVRGLNGAVRPLFASGIIDTATTTLEEVRLWTVGGLVAETRINDNGTPGEPSDDFTEVRYVTPAMINGCGNLPALSAGNPIAPFAVQQAWMLEAFPAPSQDHVITTDWARIPGPPPPINRNSVAQADRTRVRYEPEPPDYFGALAEADQYVAQMRLADQKILTASNFLPHCSEFIVEWSFGDVFFDPNNTNDPRTGRVIWHGKRREVAQQGGNLVRVADLYLEQSAWNGLDAYSVPYRLREPVTDPNTGESRTFLEHPVSRFTIHGPGAVQNPAADRVEYSYFGFVDPSFNPNDPAPGYTGERAAEGTIPWVWPELIRVTVSLADPADPSVEETFQFVFRLPGTPPP